MAKVRFVPNRVGLRQFLRNPVLAQALKAKAEEALKYAQSIAPVGDPTTDPHSGAYRDSLAVELHHSPTRVSARIVATDQKAHWIEFGAAHTTKQRVLGRSLDRIGGGHR